MTGHRVSEMKKSRASLGAITAIDRTRVNELQNPEEDRPLAAHFRASCPIGFATIWNHMELVLRKVGVSSLVPSQNKVQQRGIQATRQVLTNLLDGVPMKERHPVLVVDCMPNRPTVRQKSCAIDQVNQKSPVYLDLLCLIHTYPSQTLSDRFAEWSTACLDMLLEELGSDSHTGPCVHYMGVFLEESASMARNLEASVAGKLMANWWDSSSTAGSQRRPRSGFADPLPSLDVLLISENKCKNLRPIVKNRWIFFWWLL